MKRERVAIVGAGIVGIAHAWREAVHGADVTLFERDLHANKASIRNFGMIWPIGQPAEKLDIALESRALWDQFIQETGAWLGSVGSLHLVNHEDEVAVLEEFIETTGQSYRCNLITGEACRQLSPVANGSVLAGLHSETEATVDPRQVVRLAPGWLQERYGVQCEFGVTVSHVDTPQVETTDGRNWYFDRVTIASGADFETLFPDKLREQGLRKCKLQMMRTDPQSSGWQLGPMIASGLTLRHYSTFAQCKSLASVKERVAKETPELDEYGIHVMISQNHLGELILGDSHEYDQAIEPFNKQIIDELILKELQKLVEVPDWTIASRWHGIYPVQPSGEPLFLDQPIPGVTLAIATGGCGMTMSFGLAERYAKGLEPVSI